MVLGSKPSDTTDGTDYMMASESVALVQCGYKTFQDILPGQAVIIEKGKAPEFKQVHPRLAYSPDIFEYVYFARPDTIIDGIDVDEARQNMGYKLAETIKKQLGEAGLAEIDCVMPIPETSITSAQCVAEALNKPYVQGFVKNRYIFRTFIMPNQKARQKGVRAKLNAMPKKFAGKNVLLVDDSIVRGTTSREIVLMAREAGAKSVVFTSCAPPIAYAHIYGIDLASSSELIAHARTSQDICEVIGADAVIYQTLPDLEAACLALTPKQNGPERFEVGVFCGKYVTPVHDDYFKHLELIRGERKKAKVIAGARLAVAQGVAGDQDIRFARNGAGVDDKGNVVPNPTPSNELKSFGQGILLENGQKTEKGAVGVNGDNDESKRLAGVKQLQEEENERKEKMKEEDAHARVMTSQDISLHNINDFQGER
jgi:amidophosphoribosyltransferase